MLKEFGLGALGIALVGVFMGAATVEVLYRKKPELIKKTEDQARKTVASLGQKVESTINAFKGGYAQADGSAVAEENSPA